ncbi:MAG TPA: hypothetical protein VJ782_02195 [Aeromicrobium sp.]|nr:hypothetical protein [Aeromicrobium sp.]
MSIDVVIEQDAATFAVRPPFGKPVTFVVTEKNVNVSRQTGSFVARREAPRFVVGLKGSHGNGFSHHTTFEAACSRALSRARRYDRAYSVPRRVAA